MSNYDQKRAFYSKASAYFLGFISAVLMVYILFALRAILIPVVLAIFLTFLFHPILNYLVKLKIPRIVGLLIIIITMSGLYYLLGLIVISSLSTFPEKMEYYIANLRTVLISLLAPFNLTITEVAGWLGFDLRNVEVHSLFDDLFKSGFVLDVFNNITAFLGDFAIVLLFWLFMIMGKDKFEARLKFAFKDDIQVVEDNIKSIDIQLQSYILVKTALSLLTGLITTIILMLYNIDFAILWGLLTFLLNYIPNIGSLIATIAPITIALLEYGLGWTTFSLSALLLINQNVIGNIVEPHYLGKTMDLSPVFVLFSLIFWGWTWGIAGMFLAVPIAGAIKIFCSNIEALKPLAIIMGTKSEPIGSEKMKTIK
jgi:AI-2 transport protein TqsA